MKRSYRILSMLLAVLLLFTACSKKSDSNAEGVTPGTSPTSVRLFTDSLGRQVEVPVKPERVAASGTLAQIVLFALAPDILVGLSEEWGEGADQYIDEKYLSLPVLGQFYGKGELSLEQLVLSDPQLIIDIGQPKSSSAEDMDSIMNQVNIPTVFIEAHLDTMDEAYAMLGELLGMEDGAKVLSEYCREIYSMCSELLKSAEKTKMLYCLGEDGLNVIAKGAYHGELIDFVSDNQAVVGEISSKGTGNVASMEQLLLWNPEVIVFAPGSIYGTAAQDEAWQQLDAIKNNRYYEAPQGPYNWMGFPPSVNRYLGMLWMCGVLYPDESSYDLKEEVQRYYKLFYHCELSDEQYGSLVGDSLK